MPNERGGESNAPLSDDRGFPVDRYTPHGYLDNPRHSWRVNRSGVVRSTGEIGFSWHVPSFPGPYGKRWIYQASLTIESLTGSDQNNLLFVDHHTKELFSFRRGAMTVEMFLADEVIVAIIAAPPQTRVSATALYRRQLGVSGDWDFGLLARQDAEGHGHLAVYAEGSAFVLRGGTHPASATVSVSDAGWPDRSAPIEKSVVHEYVMPANGRLTLALARAESSDAAVTRAGAAIEQASALREQRFEKDARFWAGAPRLAGDWPDHWRRGLVYDLETLRTIVRPPAGVYRSQWDGMQIQVPRVVLAETALDMLLLSYADSRTARDVILGTFRDAIAANVPCTREDGSVNMVAVNGQACGTSPAWCWPFWCIGLLYRRTGDLDWLREILPHAERFMEWWLANRRHPDGTPYYLCGWESGQDASPRFGAAERGGGGIERVEPVDLDASIAQSARLLAGWLADMGRDSSKWASIADEYARRTSELWHKGWFHDRTPDGPTTPRDPMQLAPIMCHAATSEQVEQLKHSFTNLPSHGEYSPLEWPPVVLTAFESALQAGEQRWLAENAFTILDRVWRATDAPVHEGGHPLPGVAHEHWPLSGDWGTEGYGWGATTVLLLLRYIAGLRDEPESNELRIEPHLPAMLMRPGARYEIRNLTWRGDALDLIYTVSESGDSLRIEKSWSRR